MNISHLTLDEIVRLELTVPHTELERLLEDKYKQWTSEVQDQFDEYKDEMEDERCDLNQRINNMASEIRKLKLVAKSVQGEV